MPIEFHRVESIKNTSARPPVHRDAAGCVDGDNRVESRGTKREPISLSYSCVLARFGAFEHLVRPVFFLLGFVSQHRGFQGFKVADRVRVIPQLPHFQR